MKNAWNHTLPQNQPRSSSEMMAHLLKHRNITERGCWEWTLSVSKSGYGKVKWRPRDLRVHRVAMHLWNGFDLEDSRIVCHSCDNPRCFNPDHIWVGTHSENQQDSVRKKRHHLARKTACIRGHEFSRENTYIGKSGGRHCRACHRQDASATYRRRVTS
jgi:hypothetical protein